jgi:hypothetical protein
MPIQRAPKIGSIHAGWIIAVSVPRVGASNPLRLFFAVGYSDAINAEKAVWAHMGGLHCQLESRLSLSSRALTQLGVAAGEVRPLGDASAR